MLPDRRYCGQIVPIASGDYGDSGNNLTLEQVVQLHLTVGHESLSIQVCGSVLG
jgi:hypothetical protein